MNLFHFSLAHRQLENLESMKIACRLNTGDNSDVDLYNAAVSLLERMMNVAGEGYDVGSVSYANRSYSTLSMNFLAACKENGTVSTPDDEPFFSMPPDGAATGYDGLGALYRFAVSGQKLDALTALVERGKFADMAQLVNAAFTLTRWVIDQTAEGCEVSAIDEADQMYQAIALPWAADEPATA